MSEPPDDPWDDDSDAVEVGPDWVGPLPRTSDWRQELRAKVLAGLESGEGRPLDELLEQWDEMILANMRADMRRGIPDPDRFEVIDHRATGDGRAFVAYNVIVRLEHQDDGRTLKVFLEDRG